MIGLSFQFLAGKFHATPWGHHVNEAIPEWPVSPWRILRSLVATWKRKLENDSHLNIDELKTLLFKLSQPPHFILPPVSKGHARHYMPWFKKGPSDRTLVFDAWVALDKTSKLLCLWPDAHLDDAQNEILELLAKNLGSLGRSESWVEARVLCEDEAMESANLVNCIPLFAQNAQEGTETVRVLCVDSNTAFENSYTPQIKRTEGKGKDKKHFINPVYDPDWNLCLETLELHKKKWSDPPGSKWIQYVRPANCFEVKPMYKRNWANEKNLPTVARFALDGAVLPLVEETLKVAERARFAAMGCYKRVEEKRLYGGPTPEGSLLPKSEIFSGKANTGEPLKGHKHAFFIPTDEDFDGRIDHLTIFAQAGLGLAEQKALDRFRTLRFNQAEPLNLVLLALGQTDAIRADLILGPSKTWISATPFIVTRHAKKRGSKKDLADPREFAQVVLKEELNRLLDLRPELPKDFTVEPLNNDHLIGAHNLRPIQFKRYRQKQNHVGGRRPAGAFRITFSKPVTGPICLGHSAHFGLGLFVAEKG